MILTEHDKILFSDTNPLRLTVIFAGGRSGNPRRKCFVSLWYFDQKSVILPKMGPQIQKDRNCMFTDMDMAAAQPQISAIGGAS